MEQLNGAAVVPPIYPTCVIAGKQYAVKFGPGATFRLEKLGIEVAKLKEEMERWQTEGRNIELICTLGSVMLGQIVQGDRFQPIGLTPEQLADALPDEESMGLLAKAITEAFRSKSKPASKNLVEAPPADQIQ